MKKLFSKDFYNESATATVFAKYAEIKDKWKAPLLTKEFKIKYSDLI